jgi:hypothetical protein
MTEKAPKEGGTYKAISQEDLNEHQVAITMRNKFGHEFVYHIHKKSFFDPAPESLIKKTAKKKTRRSEAGKQTADALIEMTHMMYQKQTARGFLKALIARLKERSSEFSD